MAEKEDKIALITGMNGFIGKNLEFVLKNNGWQVMSIQRDILSNPLHTAQALLQGQPTHVFHLASYGNHSTQTEEDEIITTNYLKTFFLLKACADAGVPNFVNFSSSLVYGKHSASMNEDTPLNTNTFYGATKAGAEHLTRAYSKQHGIKTVSIRPFSVYGEGEAKHRFIPTIIDTMINNKELTLYPTPVHDWIYIHDFLDGVIVAVDNIDKLNGKAINIGTGKQYKNQEVYDELLAISKVEPLDIKIKKAGRAYDTSKRWRADNTLLTSFGWKPETSLKDGLRHTYQYYEKVFNLGKENDLAGADIKGIMDTMANKYGTGWEDIPKEEPKPETKIII